MGNEAPADSYQHFVQFGFAWRYIKSLYSITKSPLHSSLTGKHSSPLGKIAWHRSLSLGARERGHQEGQILQQDKPMMEWDPPISFSAVSLNIPISMAGTAQEEGNAVFTGKLRGGGRPRMSSQGQEGIKTEMVS